MEVEVDVLVEASGSGLVVSRCGGELEVASFVEDDEELNDGVRGLGLREMTGSAMSTTLVLLS